ncbi:MAG: M48 family metalloprotease [bacterium]|nr:M48 family metalloprotease [bacterium]
MSQATESAAEIPYGHALRDRISASFTGRIEPVAVSPLYRLGLLLVAVTMVLLPLVYVALVVLAAYGVYYHASHHLILFETIRRVKLALLAYGGPLVIGVILVFFMIKPLFARPPRGQAPRSLSRNREPILFGFVERICVIVGASPPKRIDVDCQVNASAGFRRGWLSLFGQDLVLTLGLPLVAGLSLQQLAGVLAHEFGHFAQGAGMRLTFVIRAVNFWFLRVVYERDNWDEQLENAARDAEHLAIIMVVNLARALVWLTRRVLWLLMWIGQVISCFMLRQMEFDADRYEARLVGAGTFESSCRELSNLGLSYQKSLADLSDSWQEGRLADSLPALVGANRRRMDAELLRKVAQQVDAAETGLLDTHPGDKDRIASAHREGKQAVFRSELPATALFRDFQQLAAGVSLDFYRMNLGDHIRRRDLHSVEQLVTQQQKTGEEQETLVRFFQGTAQVLRPLRVAAQSSPDRVDPGALLQELETRREVLSRGQATYQKHLESYDEADTLLLTTLQAQALLAAGLKIRAEDFGLKTIDATIAEAEKARIERRLSQLDAPMAEFENAAASRLHHALKLLDLGRLVDRHGDLRGFHQERPRLVAAAAALSSGFDLLRELHRNSVVLGILGAQLDDHGDEEQLITRFSELSKKLYQRIVALGDAWSDVAYPFEHADADATLGSYAVPAIPAAEDVGEIYALAQEALQRSFGLYMRVMGRLAFMAERLESELGLEPLAKPGEDQSSTRE